MAQTYDERLFGLVRTPEEGLDKVKRQRARKSVVAAVLFAVATVLTLGITYLMYSDVPAPQNPANASSQMVEPYRQAE